jgi:hypothetical protein
MVVDVTDVLSGRLPLCLQCLAQRTSLRVDEILRQLDAMPALHFAEGRCLSCTAQVPVIARPSTPRPGAPTQLPR